MAKKNKFSTMSKVPSDFHLLSEKGRADLIARDFEPEKKEEKKAEAKAPAKAAAKSKSSK